MLIRLAQDFGNEVNLEVRKAVTEDSAVLVDVLTRLHARACQVAQEITILLENGYADGAMARWRTMHEIEVTAQFISGFGNACAFRYVDHNVVESHRASHEYQDMAARLGYKPIQQAELESIEKSFRRVLSKYGENFGSQYGWAAFDLKPNSPKFEPKFKDIEKHVGTDFLRSHYRMASHGVHANPKGIYFSIAQVFPTEVLLAGASNAGLADAAQCAARSLLVTSSCLLSLSQSFDYQIALRAMSLLGDEITSEFVRAHMKLERDETKLREEDAAANAILAKHGIRDDFEHFKLTLKNGRVVI
jgi:hypothetical protein